MHSFRIVSSYVLATNLHIGASSASPQSVNSETAILCTSQSQPNPIDTQYPTQITGTINGTYAILSIPYASARAIVPSQNAILRHAYESLLPGWPKDMYPAYYEGLLDHDVGTGPLKIGDFQRSSIRFPFIYRLGDGHTSFRYTGPVMLSPNNLVALVGASVGNDIRAGTFRPACEAYADDGHGNTFLEGTGVGSITADVRGTFRVGSSKPYPLNIFKNMTNQPSFSSVGNLCDHYISLYNSSVTQGVHSPVPVQGSGYVRPPYYLQETTLAASL
ncbi:hypothetical protein LTR95_003782 [Oleoguttula sp. CCFEE 5521]